jgi:hypothetical protein
MSESKEVKVSEVKAPAVDPTPVINYDDEIKKAELEAKKLELQIKKRQLEALELEQEERTYHIQDLKHSLAERSVKEKQLQEDRANQGRTFEQQRQTDNYRYSICTHRKGGMVTPRDLRALSTGGNREQYAVIKHQMINGDIWVRCQRCGKTWAPPVEKNYFFDGHGRVVAPQDGVFSVEKFEKAQREYIEATMLNTNNTMSGSVQCRFTTFDPESRKMVDAADKYREALANTTLR